MTVQKMRGNSVVPTSTCCVTALNLRNWKAVREEKKSLMPYCTTKKKKKKLPTAASLSWSHI